MAACLLSRVFHDSDVSSGRAFAALDRLLDGGRTGPLHLRDACDCGHGGGRAALYGGCTTAVYLAAFVVMPNHVHILVSPLVSLPRLTKALKGYTAKRANQMLGLTGSPFWQEESYDRLVRDAAEGERIRSYIELNPVRAGLVREAGAYRWSSAGWPTGRSAADQEVRPFTG